MAPLWSALPTIPVSPQRDTWDWVLFAAQILSLLLAAAATIFSARAVRQADQASKDAERLAREQADRSAKALVRERRITFELDVLRQLVVLVSTPSNVGSVVRDSAALARLLPTELIPKNRAVVRLETTAAAEKWVVEESHRADVPQSRHDVRDKNREELQREIAQAIETLIQERDQAALSTTA